MGNPLFFHEFKRTFNCINAAIYDDDPGRCGGGH